MKHLIGEKIGWLVVLLSTPVWAQVTLDGTLGPAGALTGPDYQIGADVGRQVGSNLFHSFGLFNVNTGESATFSGPGSVNNIVGRVTGGQTSWIDGTLRTQVPGGANLWLINPAGMLFGENARLDVQGSFHASTADYLRLGEGGRFDARLPGDSVLTAAPPEAFGFLGPEPVALSVTGSELSVPVGETLSLVGGEITLDGSVLAAAGGRINLAGVGGAGEVVPTEQGLILAAEPGDITGTRAWLDASGDGGGDIYIQGGRLMLDGSFITTLTEGTGEGGYLDIEANNLHAINGTWIDVSTIGIGQGGDVYIKVAQETILSGQDDFGNSSRIFVETQGTDENAGDGGNFRLETGRLRLADGAAISTSTYGPGKGGDLVIQAQKDIVVVGENSGARVPSGIFAESLSSEDNGGNAGVLHIYAEKLHIVDGGQISTSTIGGGKAGNLYVTVDDVVEISGESGIGVPIGIFTLSVSEAGKGGNGGDIVLKAGSLMVKDGTKISAGTFGTGDGGSITLQIAGTLSLSGGDSIVSSSSRSSARVAGDGGLVKIQANQLQITNGAQILSFTNGGGQANRIEVYVDGDVTLSGTSDAASVDDAFHSAIFTLSASEETYAGNAGEIILEAGELKITNGAWITSRSFGPGQGGDIDIRVKGPITLSGISQFGFGSRINASAAGTTDNSKNSGSVNIEAEQLRLTDGGQISAATFGVGHGGDVKIRITGDVFISGNDDFLISGVFAESQHSQSNAGDAGNLSLDIGGSLRMEGSLIETSTLQADGGNVDISASELVHLDNSEITTSVSGGKGDGGNIFLKTKLGVLDDSAIVANAFGGDGGNIKLVVEQLIRNPNSSIKASSELGIDGNIEIDSPDTDISGSLVKLPSTISDIAAVLSTPCAERFGGDIIQMVERKYQLLPDSPYSLRDYLPLWRMEETQLTETKKVRKNEWLLMTHFEC